MKKTLLLLAFSFLLTPIIKAQVTYSYSMAEILSAMPAGISLPDGTIIKVEKINTGTGVIDAATGLPGPSMGGDLDSLWNGCSTCTASTTGANTLMGYTGDKNPTKFTRLVQVPAANIDNGNSTNAKDAIGWRIYFDRPLDINSFLVVDLDGNPNFNGEWSGAFSYNGNVFSNPTSKTFQSTYIQGQNITVNATHDWRTMIQSQLNVSAAANFPTTFNIARIGSTSGALDPDDPNSQVLFDFPLSTDLFFLWGVWGDISNTSGQNSGISPIVVNVFPDFGDAPDSYQTLLASNGASHGQRTSTTINELKLGATEDIEADGLPTAMANTSMDDDGVAFIPTILNNGSLSEAIPSYSLTTSFTNATGDDADFVAWIDWNNNGTFDAGEGQTVTVPGATATGNVTFTWTNVTLSGAAGLANTYARIRVTTDMGMTTATPGGAFKDGEVEDYLIPFAIPLPLKLVSFTGHLDGQNVSLNWHSTDEVNMNNYEVQISTDAVSFSSAGALQAKNKATNNYSFDYKIGDVENVYFRLKMNDIDGAFSLSNVVEIKTGIHNQFQASISPNPSGSDINLSYENSMGDMQMDLEILDLTGKALIRKTKNIKSGHHTIHLDATELPQGMYLLHFEGKNNETNGVIKFSVLR